MHNERIITVALADDHTMFRRGLISILKPYRHIRVLYDVANGQELLQKLDKTEEKPDVCVIDINMPVLNGFETARRIRQGYPNMRILALSMFNNENYVIQMLRAGANGYIAKDSEPAALISAIEKIHSNTFYHSEPGNPLDIQKYNVKLLNITPTEMEFLRLICNDISYKEVADAMNVSERTVDGYRERLFQKLGVKSRLGLVIYAMQNGYSDKI